MMRPQSTKFLPLRARFPLWWAAAFGLLAAGCAPTPKKLLAEMNTVVAERAGAEIQWRGVTSTPDALDLRVKELAAAPLTAKSALEIALINNRDFQAKLEDLGVARADLIEASTPSNPVFSGHLRYPHETSGAEIEIEVVQNVTDLLMIPARRKFAGLELERVRKQITHEALHLAAEARAELHATQAADRIAELTRLVAQTEEASADLALRMREAGNISELEAAQRLAAFEQARVDLARARLRAVEQRERLTRLLGLWGQETCFTIDPEMPEIPTTNEPSLDEVERLALERRLDLAAARTRVDATCAALGSHRFWRWFGEAEVGASAEREPDGAWSVGPAWSLRVPIFDWGRGRLARLKAEARQAQAEYEGLAIQVRSEARLARERLIAAREIADHYRARLLPLRERIAELMSQHTNTMLESPFEALMERQAQAKSYREYIETVRDYWTMRGELDLTLGAVAPMGEGREQEQEQEQEHEREQERERIGHGGHSS